MALMAQPPGQAIAFAGLAVCSTKYMVAFEVCGFAAKVAAAAAGVKNRFHWFMDSPYLRWAMPLVWEYVYPS